MTDDTRPLDPAVPFAARLGQMRWQVPRNTSRPSEPLPPEHVRMVLRAALHLLSDRGIEIAGADPGDPVLAAFRAAGCRVDGNIVRFDPDFVTEMTGKAPPVFQITPRNPDRKIPIGGQHMVFAAIASATNSWDLERGRRPGNMAACEDFLRLAQSFNCIHMLAGYPVEPQDIAPPVRHLVCTEASLRLSDKVIHAYPLGSEAVEDVITLARLAAGLSIEDFAAAPRLFVNINSLSPLTFDATVLQSAMTAAGFGQAVMVTPFVVTEAASPATTTGTVTLALAEALATIALLQHVRPGAPVILGALTAHRAPTSGSPVFGAPPSYAATEMLGQMARELRLPFRATAASTGNIPDAQTMAETANSLWAAARAGANVLHHAAGWISAGTTASTEKFVLDCEQLQILCRHWEEPDLPEDEETLLARVPGLAPVGPAGRLYKPLVADWRPYPVWEEDGAIWASERAHRVARRMLDTYEQPPLDPSGAEAMADHVARRTREVEEMLG